MKRMYLKSLVTGLLAAFISLSAIADEGMWLPLLIKRLNHADMQSKGLKLTAEEIYSVNNSSLKDAIVGLGRPDWNFCSGEIISAEGLFLTNHHCGFNTIQEISTTEHNFLRDGFWAMSRGDEKPAGFSVSILQRIEDVTPLMLGLVNDKMSEVERAQKMQPAMDSLRKANSVQGRYTAVVKSFFKGNEFYMFVYEVFPDVRLVGAPPSSIGKFGGDTDNWMWPRHTGDFTLFRIYANKENLPAPYSVDNVPYKPKHHLPVNIKGVKEGDYAMILGFPGSTDRFLTSYGVKLAIEKDQPARVKIRRQKLDLYEEGMNTNDSTRLKYAAKHASVSNYWKYFMGQTAGLKRLNVYEKKKAQEDAFVAWMNADGKRKEKYGEVISLLESGYKEQSEYQLVSTYFGEAIYGTEILAYSFGYSRSLLPLLKADEKDTAKLNRATKALLASAKDHFKDYDASIDRKVLAAMLKVYYNDIPKDKQPEYFLNLVKKNKENFDKIAAILFKKSLFASNEKVEAFLKKPSAKRLEKDPALQLVSAFYADLTGKYRPKMSEVSSKLERAGRLYIDALRQINPEKNFAPDANSTLRITYGNVGGYRPFDAAYYKFYTTAQGILEKYKPGDIEFDAPDKLLDLIKRKDYGQYGTNGELVVCFLSNNDITGGNSGSGVINGEGHLIGTAFDGNWEAMSGDIAFEPDLQRTISVDIRYTLFIIDKYAGAGHLINEMTLIK
jgi:hypothetical protein